MFNSRDQYAQYNRYFQQIKDTYETKPVVRESIQLLLSLLTISFLVLFALRPTINTISELFAKVRIQQEVSEKLDAKIQALGQAKTVWDSQQNNISLINQALPDRPQPENFLQQIEGLAAIHSLNVLGFNEENALLAGKDLRPKEQRLDENSKQDIPSTKSVRYSITVTGSYNSLSGFLKDLENLRSQNLIQSYTVTVNSSAISSSITLKIIGSVPYLDMEALKAQ